MLRNIYRRSEDPAYWQNAVAEFSNGIPKFTNREDAIKFMQQNCLNGSNPSDPTLMHSITTLVSWSQIEIYLLPKMREYDIRYSSNTNVTLPDTSSNRFVVSGADENPVALHMKSRLNLPIHREMNAASTINTLNYCFHHMRCGIYVMIRNQEIVVFCPFTNKDYHNTWGEYPEVDSPDGTIASYYAAKRSHYREENIIPDKSMWWANGNIMCNEHDRAENGATQWWGDHFLLQLKDMIAETCACRQVPDCEFFINKRDYPQLKYNEELSQPVEPYGFIFNKDDRDPSQDIPLSEHCYSSYAPIL